MRIGIFSIMAGRNAGGPATYEEKLVPALAAADKRNEYHVFCFSPAAIESFGVEQDNFHFHILWPRNRWIPLSTSLPIALIRRKVNILHATFTPPPLCPKDYLFTHHCFSTFAHPEFYDATVLKRLNPLIIRGIKASRLVLCVSENVRDLTAEKFHLPLDRFAVAYHGVDERFEPLPVDVAQETVRTSYGIDAPYFLYVGKLTERKNIARIIEAYARVRRESGLQHMLVLAGARQWMSSDTLDEVVRETGFGSDIVELGYVRHDDLPALYAASEAFMFPSLWEGFGLPIIEAMACGTPVITSDNSCLPEVAGGAALTVDAYSTDAIAEAMSKIASSSELRDTLIEKGLRRAAYFTWERCAQDTLHAYQRVAQQA